LCDELDNASAIDAPVSIIMIGNILINGDINENSVFIGAAHIIILPETTDKVAKIIVGI
jgi:hypothetical protein